MDGNGWGWDVFFGFLKRPIFGDVGLFDDI